MSSPVLSERFGYLVIGGFVRFLLINFTAAGLLAQGLPLVLASNTVLHTFAGGANDGRAPSGGMTLVGNMFYGTTRYGGAQNRGTIYRMNLDGSGYSILHHFAGGTNDGDGPQGSLIVAGSTIYGTTFNGGASNFGTVFSMQTSGSNFAVLHTFPTGTNDGTFPGSSLVLVGSTLYGVTELGGAANLGTVFKIDTNGTNYATLHQFVAGTSDGHLPFAGLTLSGSTLYGVTAQGGSGGNSGTIFKIDLDGTNFGLLYQFKGPSFGDGYNIEHRLTLVGTTLYGDTNQGGTAGTGTIFKINTNGTGYAVLYSFEGTTGNDGHPSSALTLVDDHLIGSTDPIDSTYPDILYSIKLDGSGFGVFYRFNGATTEGREPGGDLVAIGSNLYGVTSYGGGGTNNGVIYTLALPTLKIVSMNYSTDGHFLLSGRNFPNSSLTIEASSDLITDFIYLGTTTADANGVFQYDDAGVAGVPMRFYRGVSP